MTAATVVGWHGQREGKRQWRGREPNHKLRSSNASMDVDVKKHAARGGRPHPEGDIGKVESRCGLYAHRYDTDTSNFLRRLSDYDRARRCGNFSFIISLKLFNSMR